MCLSCADVGTLILVPVAPVNVANSGLTLGAKDVLALELLVNRPDELDLVTAAHSRFIARIGCEIREIFVSKFRFYFMPLVLTFGDTL